MSKRDAIIIIIFAAFIGFQFLSELATSLKRSFFARNEDISAKLSEQKTDYFADMHLEARAAVVWDARDDKVLFGKNEQNQLPLASLTKIMTAYIALQSGEPIATVTQRAVQEEGDSGLLVGEKWKLPDLAKLTLASSANDGASSLALAWAGADTAAGEKPTFVEAMNSESKRLGLSQTYFLNETGLDVSNDTAGAYGSALDIARLFYKTVTAFPSVFEATNKDKFTVYSMGQSKHVVINTNADVEKIPGLVASKTGFTTLAGGNLIVLIDAGINHPIAIAVLGSTIAGRFSDMEKLAAAAMQTVSKN